MAISQKKKIMWYPSKKEWEGFSMNIQEAVRLNDDESIQSRSDSFSFTVDNHKITSTHTSNSNFHGKYISELIDVNDRINISYGEGAGDFVEVFIGDIDLAENNEDIDDSSITISGVNRTEKLLNSIENVGSIGTSSDSATLITTLVGYVNDKSDTIKIAGGKWNSQLVSTTLTGKSQSWSSGSGLTTSISTSYKGGDNGNICITVYNTGTGTFINGLSSITFNLTGTNKKGATITDTITISANDDTNSCTKNFETITQITINDTGKSFTNHKMLVGTGGVRDVKSDTTSALATITQYYRVGKPVSEYIDELSGDEYTGDATYFYYVSSNNVLTWKPRTTIASTIICLGIEPSLGTEETDYITANALKIRHGSFDVITAIRANVGNDLNGSSISTYAFDATAVAKNGWKWAYEDFSEIANQVKEIHSGYTNDQVRTAAKDIGRKLIRNILKRTGYARYKATAKFEFNSAFVKGDLLAVVHRKKGWLPSKPYKLRIVDINNECTNQGIYTYLELEEDAETAKANSADLKQYLNPQ